MELMDLLPQVDSNKRPIARQLITELEFMKSTLEKLRAEIEANGVVEEFKNGKQEFTRETPALKSYNLTVSRYSTLYKQLTDLLPDCEPDQSDEFDKFVKGA